MRHHLIEYGRNKLNDPILMSWAVRRYMSMPRCEIRIFAVL
jgi:hypothetical protein